MEFLTNVGIMILGALGLVVFLIIIWFAIGIAMAMNELLFKKKYKFKPENCSHADKVYTDSHPEHPFKCMGCGKLI